MQKVLMLAAAFILAACGNDEILPKQKEERAQVAVNLFAQSCVALRGDPTQVSAWASQHHAQLLSEDELNKLPLGMMEVDLNTAWKIDDNGVAYYLSLAPKSCSIKTEKADENTVRQAFMKLVGQAPSGLNQELRSDQATQSPFPFSQIAYAWRAAGSPEEILLTANTSPSDQLPAQVALYLTHQTYAVTPNTNPIPQQGESQATATP